MNYDSTSYQKVVRLKFSGKINIGLGKIIGYFFKGAGDSLLAMDREEKVINLKKLRKINLSLAIKVEFICKFYSLFVIKNL